MRIFAAVILLTGLLLIPDPSTAATIHVPGDQSTIQAGIDVASAGDTVLVASDTYYENIVMADGVLLLSESGPEVTVLDGSFEGPVLTCNGLSADTRVEGFTITHGSAYSGGGVSCGQECNAIITGNVVVDNEAEYGAGICCWDSWSPSVVGNVIAENVAFSGTGGILVKDCGAVMFSDNVIRENFRGGVAFANSPTLVERNAILDNFAYNAASGLWLGWSTEFTVIVRENLFARNLCGGIGGAIYGGDVHPQIYNNTFDLNEAEEGGAVWLGSDCVLWFDHNIVSRSTGGAIKGGSLHLEINDCNDFWENEGGDYLDISPGPGDIFLNPEFCGAQDDNYMLAHTSPCLDGLGCGLMGAFGEGCDVTVTLPTTWGFIKSVFRGPGE